MISLLRCPQWVQPTPVEHLTDFADGETQAGGNYVCDDFHRLSAVPDGMVRLQPRDFSPVQAQEANRRSRG